MNQLVSTKWLDKHLDKVKILDASWHLPNVERNALKEYKSNHITKSIFFDIDKNSNQNTGLPHMLPSKKEWENIISNFQYFRYFMSLRKLVDNEYFLGFSFFVKMSIFEYKILLLLSHLNSFYYATHCDVY